MAGKYSLHKVCATADIETVLDRIWKNYFNAKSTCSPTADSVPTLSNACMLKPSLQDICVVKIERLRELGHELRRPETDLLRDGIYEC